MDALTTLIETIWPSDSKSATVLLAVIGVLMAMVKLFFGDTRSERKESLTGLSRWVNTRQERAIEKEAQLDTVRRAALQVKIGDLEDQVTDLKEELFDVRKQLAATRRELSAYQQYVGYQARKYAALYAQAAAQGLEVKYDLLTFEEWIVADEL